VEEITANDIVRMEQGEISYQITLQPDPGTVGRGKKERNGNRSVKKGLRRPEANPTEPTEPGTDFGRRQSQTVGTTNQIDKSPIRAKD
jgi:hypothetical protein